MSGKFIKKVSANIGALGVPSSPAAAGASPRRSLSKRLSPEAKYFSFREMLNFCYAKAKYTLRAS